MSEHISSSCNYSSLPPEIWRLVLECLPRTDQRSCLSVSTAFRGLAHPLIFSRIIIHYGMWKAREMDVGFSLPDLRLMEQRCTSNTELLQHVARDARFARSVRTISVRAHDAMKWCNADEIRKFAFSVQTGWRGVSLLCCERTLYRRPGINSAPPIVSVVRLPTTPPVLSLGCHNQKLRFDAQRTKYLVRCFTLCHTDCR